MHYMIDIETLATSNDAVILYIAAVRFDESTVLDTRKYPISTSGQLKTRRVDASTFEWWLKQGPEAIRALRDTQAVPLGVALGGLYDFISEAHPCIWAKPPAFDLSILEHAFYQHEMTIPWNHWETRCVRTAEMALKEKIPFEGTKHNALDDALHQVKIVQEYMRKIK